MSELIVVLRLLHIGAGIFWVGSVMLAVFFVEPVAKALGTTGDRFLAHLWFRTRLLPALAHAAVVTLAAGAALYWLQSGGLQVQWISSPTGLALGAGGLAATVAFLIALLILKPEFDRLGSTIKSDTPGDDVQRSPAAAHFNEDRVRRWSLVQVSLLVFAAATMAAARYLH